MNPMNSPTMIELPYASRLARLVDQVVDGFVCSTPIMLAALFAGVTGLHETTTGGIISVILFVVAIAWAAFYYFFADGFTGGQSYGKRMLGMHVIDAKARTPCSFGQSFVRNLVLALLGPIDAVFILGERHQRLGDMAAGTVVISEQG